MINRIVRLSFNPEKVNEFEQLFERTRTAIGGFEGCKGVRLLRDTENRHVYFTYSLWESAAALENYRQSDLFKQTWAQTKQWFNDKPMAWSLEEKTF